MSHDLPNVTETELAVLEFLWQAGTATKREIVAELYPRQADSDFATVHKLLQRLEAKGHIERDRDSFAHVFRTTRNREDFVGQQLEAVAEKLSGGSLTPLLIHLVEKRRLSKAERERIRQLLDEADDSPAKNSPANKRRKR